MSGHTVIYLHGFLSSPASAKARVLREAAQGDYVFEAPDLNCPPAEAARRVSALAAAVDPGRLTLVGASLGGFFAARAAAVTGARCVLVNPCLDPWNFVSAQLGVRPIYGTDRTLEVKPAFAGELLALAEAVPPVSADGDRTLVMLSTGDEVLDWHKASEAFRRSRQLIVPGDNHRLMRFEELMPRVRRFCLGGS